MKLVIDASVLVGELLRRRGLRLLTHPRLELFTSDVAWSETRHELEKRLGMRVRQGQVTQTEASRLQEIASAVCDDSLIVLPESDYGALLASALRRIPRDPNDAHLIALALLLEADIWTNDTDFLGCGIATWTTETLLLELNSEGAY